MRKHRSDVWLLVTVVILLAVSLLLIYAIGPRVAMAEGKAEDFYFRKHLISIGLVILMLTMGSMVSKFLKWGDARSEKIIKIAVLVVVFLNVYVGVAAWFNGRLPLVKCELGACRWMNVGMSLQPSEFLKIAMIFYVPWLINLRKEQGKYGKKEFWVPLLTVVALTVLVVGGLQKDLGNTAVILAIIATMVLISGISWRQIGILGVLFVVILLWLMTSSEHRLERIGSFLNGSYHGENALMSFGTGGLLGVGLGNSVSSTGYLPEAVSDSIYPIIGEIGGYVGAMAILAVYLVMLAHILGVARRTENRRDRLMVLGVFAWILAHVIMHVGGMVQLIPMKGTTLPFVSYGGSSLISIAFVYGIVLQKSCWTKREIINDEDSSSGGRQRGARYASYRRSA